ncbi:MAG: hypothetical protein BGO95_02415 [Micrococcales bacterium 73-13]|nr:MAG: hypothetical protein BGO95_02415 [Micrococcales bacterium 73-13]
MPEPSRATVVRWPVPIALAVPALAAAIAVTFSGGHSAEFGLVVFAAFGVLTAVASAIGAGLLPAGTARTGAVLKAVAALAGGVVAAILPLVLGPEPALRAAALVAVIAGTLALLAVVDLVVGIRSRRADRYGRDWIATGVIEAAGALAVVAVPPTFFQAFSFTDHGEVVSGALTSSTMIVGLFGAVAAILGVLLAIAGVGLVPQRRRAAA